MKHRMIVAALFAVVFVCAFALPLSGFAQETVTAPKLNVQIPGLDFTASPIVRNGNQLMIPFLSQYISAVNRYLVGASIIAAAIMIVYGGFLYIAGSTRGDVGRGKEKIQDAVVGLILILCTYIILYTVNSNLTKLRAITVTSIPREEYTTIFKNGDMTPADHEKIGGPPPPNADTGSTPLPPPTDVMLPEGGTQLAGSDTAFGKMCGADPTIKIPEARPCANLEDCYQKFCSSSGAPKGGPIKELPGFPKDEDIKKFDYFPHDAAAQISQYGIAFIPVNGLGPSTKKKISETKVLNFSGVSGGKRITYYSQDGAGMLPAAHDAFIRAGQIAKSKGYFIIPQDTTRTMAGQVGPFCQRVHDLREKGESGTQGLALPGYSSHQFGLAFDGVLAKLNDDGTFQVVTTGGPICDGKGVFNNEIDHAVLYGLENARLFQSIMSAAGFKRLCSEMWHFDYLGVYASDCGECFFPPKYREDMGNCKGKIQYCKDHPTEGSCKELK
ncbi:MAG: hypothetical protein ABIO72_00750 [Patescibacteria group bacterium]